MDSICFGTASSARRISCARLAESMAHPAQMHGQQRQNVSVEMKALVEATPISGPACM